jgi:hypothetical protein
MSHVLHVFRKDVRRLRWVLVSWLAVVIARLILKTAGAELSFGAVGLQIAVANIGDLLLFIEILLLALIVSGLVHDEPLVGADAFWLTRPIGAPVLLSAKLLFAAVFLVVVPTVGESIAIAMISGDLQVVLRAAPAYAFSQMLWVSLLMALAAVTPSLMRFLLTLVGGVAAVAIGLTLVVAMMLVFASVDDNGYTESVLMDGTSGVVATLLMTCAALLAVGYQYWHRRARRTVVIGVVGIIAAIVIADRWPWHFALPAEPDPGAWAQDAGLSPAVLDAGVAPRTSDEPGFNRAAARKYVAAPLRLAGVPPSYSADRTAAKTRIEFPDGARLESAQARDSSVELTAPGTSLRMTRLQSALGGMRLLTPDDSRRRSWPVLLNVTDQEYERHGRTPGRLTAMVHFFMYRSRLIGAIPLAAHASVQDGPRFEVLRVLRRPDGCTVLVRRIGAEPLSRPSVPKQYDFVLRNAARQEAVLGATHLLSAPGPRVANVLIPGGISVGNESPAFGFDLADVVAEFPERSFGSVSASSPIDTAWLDGADLVVIETAYAGRVSRTVTVDGFTMR